MKFQISATHKHTDTFILISITASKTGTQWHILNCDQIQAIQWMCVVVVVFVSFIKFTFHSIWNIDISPCTTSRLPTVVKYIVTDAFPFLIATIAAWLVKIQLPCRIWICWQKKNHSSKKAKANERFNVRVETVRIKWCAVCVVHVCSCRLLNWLCDVVNLNLRVWLFPGQIEINSLSICCQNR